MAEHRPVFSVRAMCRCLRLHPSGFYAWVQNPLSHRAKEDERQTKLLKEAWEESGHIYGYRKLHDDLCDLGETCCPNRVARLARLAGVYAQIGYKRRPGKYGGKPSVVVDNTLDRQFDVEAPNNVWVTDITYIKIHEGFSYLAVVIDLFSRRIVGWAMQNRQPTDLVLQVLLMAVWRRKPTSKVLVHSDQGSQFTSIDWASFLKHHNLEHSMSRRGNCHDNAVAESFFNLLKRERIRRRTYKTREDARSDVFDYIEMFYNPKHKHAKMGCCRQQTLKGNKNGNCKASKKLGAIQSLFPRQPQLWCRNSFCDRCDRPRRLGRRSAGYSPDHSQNAIQQGTGYGPTNPLCARMICGTGTNTRSGLCLGFRVSRPHSSRPA